MDIRKWLGKDAAAKTAIPQAKKPRVTQAITIEEEEPTSPPPPALPSHTSSSPSKRPLPSSSGFVVPPETSPTTPLKKACVSPTKATKVRLEEPVIPQARRAEEGSTSVKAPMSPEKVQERRDRFIKFMHRGGPPRKGEKVIPRGPPTCLRRFQFVITGVLDSLEREEAVDLVKSHGGKVTGVVSKRTTHLLLGTEPGESKLKKAKELQIPSMSEDELLAIIAKAAGKSPPARSNQADSSSSPAASSSVAPSPSVPPQPIRPYVKGEKLWTDKYRPRLRSEIVGNPGCTERLLDWLKSWHANTSQARGAPRAALLSGPPGIGKTTTALVVTREAGFDPLEFNASDTRNKLALKSVIQSSTSSRAVTEFFSDPEFGKGRPKPLALVMDEVDGMSGGDRGGMAELIQLIKKTKVPVICICNDRSDQKVRSLSHYCLDLPFHRPMVASVRSRLEEICQKEGYQIEPNAVDKLAESCHGDVRQMINMLQTWRLRTDKLTYNGVKSKAEAAQKDLSLSSPFDIYPRFVRGVSASSVSDRINFYFMDSSLMPLFVQENYLSVFPSAARGDDLALMDVMERAAESISDSDLVDQFIHRDQRWELAPLHGVLSCVRPGSIIQGSPQGRFSFPSWLGKRSTQNKNFRLLKEAHLHSCLCISGSRTELRLDYLPVLHSRLVKPLVSMGPEGVDVVMTLLDAYCMTRDDWDTIADLSTFSTQEDMTKKIVGQTKSAFTRRYNAGHHSLVVAPRSGKPEKERLPPPVGETGDGIAVLDAEPGEEEEEENGDVDDIQSDKLIKRGKGKGKGRAMPKGTGTTSKGKRSGEGSSETPKSGAKRSKK